MSVNAVSLQAIQATFEQLVGVATTKPTDSQELFAKLIAALQVQDTTTVSSDTPTGSDIVSAASKYEGVPYVFGGTSSTGLDCTGLVQKALGDAGITVGRSMDAQMTAGTEVGKLANAKPGDLIVLDGGAHIVIYAGNGEVIHAPSEGKTVTKQKIWFDDSEIATIRRVAPDAPVAAATTATSTSDALQALINAQAAILTRSIS